MRFVLAAALAFSVAGAAWAVEPSKSVTEVSKTSAITELSKDWNQTRCWICLPWWTDK